MSGISPMHVKGIIKDHPWFLEHLRTIYNILLDAPQRMSEIPLLYQYRNIFIPKNKGTKKDYRPLAIIECFLMPLHKFIKDKLMGWMIQSSHPAIGKN